MMGNLERVTSLEKNYANEFLDFFLSLRKYLKFELLSRNDYLHDQQKWKRCTSTRSNEPLLLINFNTLMLAYLRLTFKDVVLWGL